MLLSLGIIAMSVHSLEEYLAVREYTNAGHSAVIMGLAFFFGTYAGCIASIVIAPRQTWRTMGYIAVIVGVVWSIYGQIYAGNEMGTALIESLGAFVGAGLAYFTAYRLFGRTAAALA